MAGAVKNYEKSFLSIPLKKKTSTKGGLVYVSKMFNAPHSDQSSLCFFVL
jgi:hypothetical protein